MQFDAALMETLLRLATGQIAPDEWLAWWQTHADSVATQLKRGQFLRLKPLQPGEWGPACRSAMVSQTEAVKLLHECGIEVAVSGRYTDEWNAAFKQFCADGTAEAELQKKRYLPQIKELEENFPKFSRFLKKNLHLIDPLHEPADEGEVIELEAALGHLLPPAYRGFLLICKALELPDTLRLGLPFTSVHKASSGVPLPTAGLLCFGECWREADGDQVLFGRDWKRPGADPAIFYYAHEASPPEVRQVGDDFTAWLEGVPKWREWKEE